MNSSKDHPPPKPTLTEQATRASCVACPTDNIDLSIIDSNTNSTDMDDRSFGDNSNYDSSSSDDDDYPLRSQLAQWAGTFNISHTALYGLLSFLQKAGVDVPKDPRMLLATPKHTDVVAIAGGSYYYFGVANVVRQKMTSFSGCEGKNML